MGTTSKILSKSAPPAGIAPSIVLTDPRFPHNVGMTVRLASCYGIKQVWFTGERVQLELESKKRLPREERMKGYRDVEMINYERPLEQFARDVVPVAVEVRANSERLDQFVHPKNAVYVFGPEDGDVPASLLACCHRFLVIPTRNRHCLNLATAVATILWHRAEQLGELPDTVSEEEGIGHEDTNPKDIGVFGI
jgi:tRNA(Leu) C34 or U34 (ribose-2'-O)-methylase TrmL